MRLSLLDFFQSPATLASLVPLADRLGFHRFWIGEHHSATQCPNPLLVCGILAGLTERMRVGTGAVLLQRRTPYEVAQDARVLAQLYGDRIDLGVTGISRCGPHGWHWTPRGAAGGDDERSVVELLHRYLRSDVPETADARAGESLAWTDVTPRLWILGTTVAGAELAGRLGVGYCTSCHHEPSVATLRDCVAAYRRAFEPGAFAQPSVVVVQSGVCATSPARLDEQVRRVRATPADPTLGRFVRDDLLHGLADHVVAELLALGARVHADEVMFLPLDFHCSSEQIEETMEALAEAAGLARDP